MGPFAVHKHLILLDPKIVKIALFDFFDRLNITLQPFRELQNEAARFPTLAGRNCWAPCKTCHFSQIPNCFVSTHSMLSKDQKSRASLFTT